MTTEVDRIELGQLDSATVVDADGNHYRCDSIEVDETASGFLVRFVDDDRANDGTIVVDLSGVAAARLIETLTRRIQEAAESEEV